jgi:hypothetical protein
MRTITEGIKFNRVAPNSSAATTYTLAAGTTDVNSSAVDTLGFSSVAFAVILGTLTASMTLGLSIEESDSGSGDWTAISGASYTATGDADDDKIVLLEKFKPAKRYVRVAFDRGTANAVIDGLVAMLGGANVAPVTHGAMVETAVQV